MYAKKLTNVFDVVITDLIFKFILVHRESIHIKAHQIWYTVYKHFTYLSKKFFEKTYILIVFCKKIVFFCTVLFIIILSTYCSISSIVWFISPLECTSKYLCILMIHFRKILLCFNGDQIFSKQLLSIIKFKILYYALITWLQNTCGIWRQKYKLYGS